MAGLTSPPGDAAVRERAAQATAHAYSGREAQGVAATPPRTDPGQVASPPVDAFPHTRRPLPWFLAGFLVLLFLVPIDSTNLRLHLPFDSHIDRFAVTVLVGAWLWFGGDQRTFANPRRSKLFAGAATIYVVIAVAGLVLHGPRIVNLGEFTPGIKGLATLMSFIVVGWFALTAVRHEDLRGFANLLTALGCVTAVGVVIERRLGYNAFYTLGETILSPIAQVAPSPTVIHPALGSDGRVVVVGPTLNGLALAAMLMTVVPFPLVRMLDAASLRRKLGHALVLLLLLAASMATDKKTAVAVPIAIVAFVAWYRPRQMLRLLPVGLVVAVGLVHFASPGAIGSVFSADNTTSNSTRHRLADFTTVLPDILAHPLIGRGIGTVQPDLVTQFRINDNEYIDQIWEVGVLGLVAFVMMILAPVLAARHTIRRGRDPTARAFALATAAACVGYLVATALFDAMSFPQAPYSFFIIAALATVAAGPAAERHA
ncbi:MAG: O-antigen ligase family protein [Solirubrobacteraceae bacterium]